MTANFHRLVPLAGYPLVMLMLGLAWWNPKLLPQADPVDLVVVMDESDSMDPAFVDHAWSELRRLQSILPTGGDFCLIRFADRPREEIAKIAWSDAALQRLLLQPAPPRTLALNTQATALTDALKPAVEKFVPEHTGVILLLSDGRDNVSNDAPVLPDSASNKTLFWHSPANKGQSHALKIASVNAPARVRPNLTFQVSALIASINNGEGILSLELDGRHLTEQSVDLSQQDHRVHRFQLSIQTTGAHRLDLLLSDTQGRQLDSRLHYFETVKDRQLLYLSNQSNPSLEPALLEQNGWQVTHLRPEQLNNPGVFNESSLLLLDDIAIHELAAPLWDSVTESVEQRGMGLVVLGGPNSFGSGGYRHSPLEHLLPVTAESARPEPATAFIFLVDKSGSMDVSANQPHSRLATAFRAVAESARSLRSGDSVGLIAFDSNPQMLLPLQATAEPHILLSQTWQVNPSGGTQLEPALHAALIQLESAKVKKRFLILVTDGFVEKESLVSLAADLQQTGVTLIALAIGEDADLFVLEQLAAVSNGQVLRVNEIAELPKFMRQSLEQQRQSWQVNEAQPQTLLSLPFIETTPASWEPVQGYQVSRIKPEATRYVSTIEGDPLLAVAQAGTGRVAALPGGPLYSSGSTEVMQSLLSWVDTQLENPRLQLSHRSQAGRLLIRLDALDSTDNWSRSPHAELTLKTPAGIQEKYRLPLTAPGRYAKEIKAPVSGLYQAQVMVNGDQIRQLIHHVEDLESADTPTAVWLQEGIEQKNVHLWSEQALLQYLEKVKRHTGVREIWLALGLSVFLFIVLHERRAGMSRILSIIRRDHSIGKT